MRTWLAMLAIAAVLIGCGTFFALQDVGTANEYASIASFFLALVTTCGSVFSLVRSKAKDQAKSSTKQPDEMHSGPTNIAFGNEIVLQGEGAHVKYTKIIKPQPGHKARRKA